MFSTEPIRHSISSESCHHRYNMFGCFSENTVSTFKSRLRFYTRSILSPVRCACRWYQSKTLFKHWPLNQSKTLFKHWPLNQSKTLFKHWPLNQSKTLFKHWPLNQSKTLFKHWPLNQSKTLFKHWPLLIKSRLVRYVGWAFTSTGRGTPATLNTRVHALGERFLRCRWAPCKTSTSITNYVQVVQSLFIVV